MRFSFLISVLSLFVFASCEYDEDHCPEDERSETDVRCYMIPDPGPCEARIIKYYYDPVDGKCKPFEWGGCEGVVPFATVEECRSCAGTNNNAETNSGFGIDYN